MKRAVPTIGLLLASCEPATGPDMRPVGDGLQFLGFSLVLATIVLIIGLLVIRRGQ